MGKGKDTNMKRIGALLLTFALLLTIFVGCDSDRQDPGSSSEESVSSSSSSQSSTSSSEPAKDSVTASIPDFVPEIEAAREINDETVGWVEVYNTAIADAVLLHVDKEGESTKNNYYWRRNFKKEEGMPDSFNGVYYCDYRTDFGDYTRKDLPTNLTIYGHAMTDTPTSSQYEIKFGPLHDLRDPELAVDMPYIFFATDKEKFAYEICAVFTAHVTDSEFPYNNGSLNGEDFHKLVEEKILPRSIYNYDSAKNLTDTDKYILLSTCIYVLPDGTQLGYPNDYRMVVMGRLVDEDAPMKKQATFTENEELVIDK